MPPKLNLQERMAKRKRLIILCDGTWQDSTNDDPNSYPTNVTRLSRALSRNGRIMDPETGEWKRDRDGNPLSMEQIVFYQKGVGTGLLDSIVGGAGGIGVSAHVRAAYAFLAHNYEDGDQIFVFGFSRGAYTARSVAAMIARYGLLTPLGMDQFPLFYNSYYKFYANRKSPDVESEKKALAPLLREPVRLRQSASNAVKIIGVWDTVGAITPWLSVITRFFGGASEKDESVNQDLPERVTWAFQALALDEKRRMYQPMLWHMPKHTEADKHSSPNPGLNDVAADDPTRMMKQVWFSGAHSDIGGGNQDSHLSDIALGWMIAECANTKLLEFEDDYLIQLPDQQINTMAVQSAKVTAWNTLMGATKKDVAVFSRLKNFFLSLAPQHRIPLSKNYTDRETYEYIHTSINSRKFNFTGPNPPFTKTSEIQPVVYPSGNLTGYKNEHGWTIKSKDPEERRTLKEIEPLDMEFKYKGRIRNADEAPIVAASRHTTLDVLSGGASATISSETNSLKTSNREEEPLIQGRFEAS